MEEIKWYENIPYDQAKNLLREKIQYMSRSFIAAGYYMKYIRDHELYKEDGYESIWEFAEDNYGIKRTTASRWMAMNDRFSKDGNTPIMAEEFKSFGKSQLQEMLYLDDKQMEDVKPDMTVKEIREIRKPEVVESEGVETEDEEELLCDECANASALTGKVDLCANCGPEGRNFKERNQSEKEIQEHEQKERPGKKCIIGISKSGICGAAAYCSQPVECCAECNESCNGRCGWLPEKQKEKCATSHTEEQIPGQMDIEKDFPEYCPESIKSVEEDVILEVNDVDQSEEAAGYPAEDIIDAEILSEEDVEDEEVPDEPVMTELQMAREELTKEQHNLKLAQEAFADEPNNVHVLRHKIRVAALASLVFEFEQMEEKEQQVQPDFPALKNNKQREEWLDTFHEWPVWFKVPEASEVYYRYDLPNGSSIVICEYNIYVEWKERYTDETPESKYKKLYLLKPGYKYLANCESNKTQLVDWLRGIGNVKNTQDNRTIDDLGFSVRTYNALKRAGIDTVKQLKHMSDVELARVRNLDGRGFSEIKEKLKR